MKMVLLAKNDYVRDVCKQKCPFQKSFSGAPCHPQRMMVSNQCWGACWRMASSKDSLKDYFEDTPNKERIILFV